MDRLSEIIYREISSKRSIMLVGKTNSGKTWYVKNTLIPFIEARQIKVTYFPSPDSVDGPDGSRNLAIVDEVETLFDQEFLKIRSANTNPYYSQEYMSKIKIWNEKLKKLTAPCVYILTRNDNEEIDYIINNLKITDWEAEVTCLAFSSTPRRDTK